MLFPLGFLEHGYADVPTWPLSAWLVVIYLVPIFALVQAVLILGEQPSPIEIVGGAITLAGVRIAALRSTRTLPLEEIEPA